jgi:hypothetical protein
VREVNTTALITHWSMEGTMRDLLQPPGFPEEIVAPAAIETAAGEPTAEPSYVLVKRPDEDEWQPLLSDD